VPFAYRFEPIKESLIDAGFAGISATVLKSQKRIADFATLARGLVYGSPTIDQVHATASSRNVSSMLSCGIIETSLATSRR